MQGAGQIFPNGNTDECLDPRVIVAHAGLGPRCRDEFPARSDGRHALSRVWEKCCDLQCYLSCWKGWYAAITRKGVNGETGVEFG